jgi:DNA-directed RNA polymerase specialized sigma24 family protein
MTSDLFSKFRDEPSLGRRGGALRPHGRRERHVEAIHNGAGKEAGQVLAELYHDHYPSLFRLAALLTGDTRAAEAVAQDSFVALHRFLLRPPACDDGLPRLRRLVVARSRRAARHAHHNRRADHSRAADVEPTPADVEPAPAPGGLPGSAGSEQPGSEQAAQRFESSPVTLALRGLPALHREAVVLTLYLDLTDEQAAEAMRVSQTDLRRYLAAGSAALRGTLPADL